LHCEYVGKTQNLAQVTLNNKAGAQEKGDKLTEAAKQESKRRKSMFLLQMAVASALG